MYIVMAVHRHNTRVNLNFQECIRLLVINTLVSAEPGHRMVCRMAGNCYGTTPSENSEKSQFVAGYSSQHESYKQFEQTGDVQRNKPIYLRAQNGQQQFFIDLGKSA